MTPAAARCCVALVAALAAACSSASSRPVAVTSASPSAPSTVSQCIATGPILGDISRTFSRVTQRIITASDGAAELKSEEARLDALAQEVADPQVASAMHGVADVVGKIRVAILDGDPIPNHDQSVADEALLSACRKAQ